jgi:hypothetical protein
MLWLIAAQTAALTALATAGWFVLVDRLALRFAQWPAWTGFAPFMLACLAASIPIALGACFSAFYVIQAVS